MTVNGHTAVFGQQVEEGDLVCVNGRPAERPACRTYLAFYKPRGIVCTAEKREAANLTDFLHYPKRVTYAGRLDKESEGLLLLTDDGDLIDALMTGSNGHEKEYVVRVAHSLTEEKIERLRKGVFLEEIGRRTRPCRVWRTGEQEFRIILTQGINRQIRRMCKNVGLRVTELKRVRVGNILLGDLKSGAYRHLTKEELRGLRELTAGTKRSNLRDPQDSSSESMQRCEDRQAKEAFRIQAEKG